VDHHPPAPRRKTLRGALATPLTPRAQRLVRAGVNLAGAATAALFARATVIYFLHTHRLTGALFVIEQTWFAVAFLIRRPPGAVTRSLPSWLAAAGGTFGGLLLRPGGAHPAWGAGTGFGLQVAGHLAYRQQVRWRLIPHLW
jgi:hypothetical protein